MAELSERSRSRLPKSKFAYVDSKGEGHLPIEDEAHIRNAMARWNQTHFETATSREQARRRILAAAREHGIDVNPDDNVAHSAKADRR